MRTEGELAALWYQYGDDMRLRDSYGVNQAGPSRRPLIQCGHVAERRHKMRLEARWS